MQRDFNGSRLDVHGDLTGQPSTSRTDVNMTQVEELILKH